MLFNPEVDVVDVDSTLNNDWSNRFCGIEILREAKIEANSPALLVSYLKLWTFWVGVGDKLANGFVTGAMLLVFVVNWLFWTGTLRS